ncbi:DUF3137 domain-containing protein [Alkalimonas mucilaginosa]|uniref:DUF3137 domain-containing protein n=1 Tax=Alkalimonas mucilaginosa TaxID=3057676 RepID=A0ABU7JBC5_9GAMM|nr:DUF3137 domain-containing protein [Alkalimonas sp. MEB004]MEE2022997.1 DUF3137 domain-containing protein [Alkalimonas sp. MEB004]
MQNTSPQPDHNKALMDGWLNKAQRSRQALSLLQAELHGFVQRWRRSPEATPQQSNAAASNQPSLVVTEQDSAALEQLRQQLIRSAWPVRKVAIPSLLLYLFLCVWLFPLNQWLNLLLITIITGLFLLFLTVREIMLPNYQAFSEHFRHHFVPALARNFANISYQQNGQLDPSLFVQRLHFGDNRLHPGKTVARSEQSDYFRGNHRGCAWELVQVSFYNQQDTQLFCGQLVLLTLPKHFAGSTSINMPCLESSASRVHLENSDFTTRFSVMATDQISARSWLTPAVMTRLEQLSQLFSDKLRANLSGNSLLLLLPAKQLVALPAIDEPITQSQAGLAFVQELQLFHQLIDALVAQFPTTQA